MSAPPKTINLTPDWKPYLLIAIRPKDFDPERRPHLLYECKFPAKSWVDYPNYPTTQLIANEVISYLDGGADVAERGLLQYLEYTDVMGLFRLIEEIYGTKNTGALWVYVTIFGSAAGYT